MPIELPAPKYNYPIEHISSNRMLHLNSATLMRNKPELMYSTKAVFTPMLVLVDIKHKKIEVHQYVGTTANEMKTAETDIRNILNTRVITFYKNKAWLLLNHKYGNNTELIFDLYNERDENATYTVRTIMDDRTLYNICAVDFSGEGPICYKANRASLDMDALLLVEMFEKLSFIKGTAVTSIGTKFMTKYIVKQLELDVETPFTELPLIERSSTKIEEKYNVAVPRAEFKVYFNSNKKEESTTGSITEVEDMITISEIIFVTGLEYFDEEFITVENNLTDDLENIQHISASKYGLVFYVLEKDYSEKVAEYIKEYCTTGGILKEPVVVRVIDEDARRALFAS